MKYEKEYHRRRNKNEYYDLDERNEPENLVKSYKLKAYCSDNNELFNTLK